ncbi:MAG TPA: pilus assembly protein PilM [Anaerohalosphaeraceae bacterium]|nr:pilus assembly protein PilM [Phycisphaerae bacterium]HOK95016.1 pilus assembly protein PilM [Anaerohalosphaeraceae bacterium]HOL30551.1 pilus assembly protein PilM [Anaerohalosphaeraceae bacterium]HOM75197.1 pilus assembly protein PilM [Anaerohalosphaeraceae bacterium]HPC64009.1 pilus assembly protein PilM [Anaerohalosphaeraceae bacterium]
MAAAAQGVWAIDVGTNALKALQMRHGDQGLEVTDFAYIEHSKNLSSGDLQQEDKDQIIAETLRKLLDEKDLSKSEVAISIAGQNSFARFVKLPPVEPKKIPEIVQFEAVQQIPFDINEVEWDWQLMEAEDSPDKSVGLFAIKNELIAEVMDHFTKEKLRVTCVQIAPMALYNYAVYDLKELEQFPQKAVIILDVGAENTTLAVCSRDTIWQRSIRIGGNTFTRAIADAFHKNFETAEKLKRTAPMSKYMRQIYTAMKSVYTDLGSEIQRSLGFYSSSPEGRDKTFSKVIAMGGGMKLQGLSKYLTQTLGMQVIKPDTFERLAVSPDISVAKFHENVSDFGIAYGLGVQLLGEAKIRTNLLPRKIARAMAWTRKARIFTAAASVLLAVMVLGLGRAYKDLKTYDSHQATRNEAAAILGQINAITGSIAEQQSRLQPLEDEIKKYMESFKYRQAVPQFVETLVKCLPNKENTPEQKDLYEAVESGNVEGVLAVPRPERKLLFITRIAMEYSDDLAKAKFPQPGTQDRTMTPRRRTPTMPILIDPMLEMMQPPVMPGGDMGIPGAPMPGTQTEKTGMGFTLLIEGYSPYRKISELLDPVSVGEDQSRWGVVTRFENLAKLFPGIPFELFDRHDVAHFKVETGLVDLDSKTVPPGIGIIKEVERVPKPTSPTGVAAMPVYIGDYGVGGRGADYVYTETVLVDPMTGEEISKTFDIITQKDISADPRLTDKDLGKKKFNPISGAPQYIERDYWFRIQAKFVWKEAPPKPEGTAAGAMIGM